MSALPQASPVAYHFIDRLYGAEVKQEPYPHTYITRVFPQTYYEEMLKNLPPDEAYNDRTFENRAMVKTQELGSFWKDLNGWMLRMEVIQPILEMFELKPGRLMADIRLVRDSTGYAIKPHTDIKSKLVSFLCYLAKDEEDRDAGTSVMVPKTRGFSSDGLSRYPFEDFNIVYTAPFLPNTMFGFPRSDISFHGVVETKAKVRNVLLLNLYA